LQHSDEGTAAILMVAPFTPQFRSLELAPKNSPEIGFDGCPNSGIRIAEVSAHIQPVIWRYKVRVAEAVCHESAQPHVAGLRAPIDSR
jgi:hypothetical protein